MTGLELSSDASLPPAHLWSVYASSINVQHPMLNQGEHCHFQLTRDVHHRLYTSNSSNIYGAITTHLVHKKATPWYKLARDTFSFLTNQVHTSTVDKKQPAAATGTSDTAFVNLQLGLVPAQIVMECLWGSLLCPTSVYSNRDKWEDAYGGDAQRHRNKRTDATLDQLRNVQKLASPPLHRHSLQPIRMRLNLSEPF